MNDKIKRFYFYNIFFLCAFLGLFMVLNLKSFARPSLMLEMREKTWEGEGYNYLPQYHIVSVSDYNNPTSYNYCFYHVYDGEYRLNYLVCDSRYSPVVRVETINFYGERSYISTNPAATTVSTQYGTVKVYPTSNYVAMKNNKNFDAVVTDGYAFDNLNAAADYVLNGVVPEVPFDETLKLDTFKITSWKIGTSQAVFNSKLEVTWSDSRIANVQVKIVGTANSPASFESNSSPFKQKFRAGNYVMKNGDVIHFTATPFKSNGEYGESLYYSLIYDDNLPSNWYRKLVNTPYNDTTITIPYTNVSGQPQNVTLPVDGVTTNKVYKVNYNPVTYEYGDINIYDIYYTPVIVYPDDTPEEEIDETQDTIINDYTTNNYNTINNITNYEFNIDFGDISNNDIQDSYDDVGNFLNGFGSFIAKIVNFFGVLFPFFPAGVSIAIITAFGIIALLLIVALVIKIVSAIKNFIF